MTGSFQLLYRVQEVLRAALGSPKFVDRRHLPPTLRAGPSGGIIGRAHTGRR